MATDERISLSEASRRSGVPETTLKRWASQRVLPVSGGRWTAAAAAQARIILRMRGRGHSLRDIRNAVRDGRLAFGSVEELLPIPTRNHTRAEAAAAVGLEEELIERIMALLGAPMALADRISDEDIEALDRMAGVLRNGFPLIALLQLVRVYAQAGRRIAEAEVRLFHLFVHEPMIREGVPPLEMAEDMERMASELIPSVTPVVEYIHDRYLRFYMEQDVVGHMEADLPTTRSNPDRVSMAFCFVDLTGFTRFTDEEGDEEALDLVERFVETVEATLPVDATIVKTIGDEVMIVSSEPRMLTEWAVGFLTLFDQRPRPRVGINYGNSVYRDGDYFGRDVNLTHRVVTRALAGEVLVTRTVVDAIGPSEYLDLEPIGEVALKGFPEPTELFVACARSARIR
jgi:adenylate cyclase